MQGKYLAMFTDRYVNVDAEKTALDLEQQAVLEEYKVYRKLKLLNPHNNDDTIRCPA